MLRSYEAIYENGQVKWLSEEPPLRSARIIVTVLGDSTLEIATKPETRRRVPPDSIAGKGRTLGNIVSPIVSEEDWECLK